MAKSIKNKKPNMKQFKALLNQDISLISSGSLVVGNLYQIQNYQSGDDFTNSGAANNNNGTYFIANNTTPTWINGSELVKGFEILLTVAVNTFSNPISAAREEPGYNKIISQGNEFAIGKTFVWIGENNRPRAYLGKNANYDSGFIELFSFMDGVASDYNVIEKNNIELNIEVYP